MISTPLGRLTYFASIVLIPGWSFRMDPTASFPIGTINCGEKNFNSALSQSLHASNSSAVGQRSFSVLHLALFTTPTFDRSMFKAFRILSNNFPARPTNGRLSSSSFFPGFLAINTNFAPSGPSPGIGLTHSFLAAHLLQFLICSANSVSCSITVAASVRTKLTLTNHLRRSTGSTLAEVRRLGYLLL